MNINIGISGRHIHLSLEDLETLFGKNYKLTEQKKLTQDNNIACVETVDLINGDKILKKVRIVGPTRNRTQAEISKTDAFNLGVNPPYRNSGDLDNSEKIKIKGPLGEVERECLIIANRHIHMSIEESIKYNLKNDEIVSVKLSGERGGILDNVHIKVAENSTLELHIDLDDANSHNVKKGDSCKLIKYEVIDE